jgi:hypothetical protein
MDHSVKLSLEVGGRLRKLLWAHELSGRGLGVTVYLVGVRLGKKPRVLCSVSPSLNSHRDMRIVIASDPGASS